MSTAPAQASPAESARAEGHPFRSGRHAARSTSGAQAQLDHLARAGVVTHLVGHGESIDPLFAVGQLRDLPEVRFVAAFREGVIALGCPDGLPDVLKNLAAPISVPTDVPATEPMPEVKSTLHAILERLAALEGSAGLDAINERLSALDTMGLETARLVGELAHAAAEKPTEDSKENLKEFFEVSFSALKSDQDGKSGQTFAAMTEISERLGAVEAQIDNACREAEAAEPSPAAEAPLPPAILSELGTLTGALPDIGASLGRVEEMLAGAIHQGNTRLDDVLSQVSTLERAEAGTPESDAKLELIAAKLEDIQRLLGDADLRTQQSDMTAPQNNDANSELIEAKLNDILNRLEDAKNGAQQTEDAAQNGMQDTAAKRTAILAALAQVQEKIDSFAARPDPILDLTAQRQSFAQFGTVMKMIVQRLEGTADQIKNCLEASTPTSAANDTVDLSAQLESLPNALVGALRGSPEAAAVVTQLAQIRQHLEALPTNEQIEGVNSTLQNLASRPKPVLDLTEQRRSFAAFTTALANVVQRLEKSADRFGESPEPETGENPMMALIAQLPEQFAALIPPATDVEAMAAQLSKSLPDHQGTDVLLAELQTLPERINTLAPAHDITALEMQIAAIAASQADLSPSLAKFGQQIEALEALPAPLIDMTEQRASFAMFSTALATVIARLESAVDKATATGPASENSELSAQLGALLDRISSLAPDRSGLEGKIETLAPLADVPAQIAQMQSSLEAQLADQVTPQLDLTAQRQSLARFAVAAQQVIARLEAVAEGLPDQIDAKDAARHRPLAKRMRRLEGQVAALRTTQDDTAAHLIGFLETLAIDAETSPTEDVADMPLSPKSEPAVRREVQHDAEILAAPPSFAAVGAPLDSLRFCFAEMIASQIRDIATEPSQG